MASICCSSTSTLATTALPSYRSANCSITGPSILQGPHHVAKKSIMAGFVPFFTVLNSCSFRCFSSILPPPYSVSISAAAAFMRRSLLLSLLYHILPCILIANATMQNFAPALQTRRQADGRRFRGRSRRLFHPMRAAPGCHGSPRAHPDGPRRKHRKQTEKRSFPWLKLLRPFSLPILRI